MNNISGMDIEGVRGLATQFRARAEEIDTIATTLSTALEGTTWLGPDATAFRTDWASSYQTQLMAVSNALRDAATRATINATQQEQTSAS